LFSFLNNDARRQFDSLRQHRQLALSGDGATTAAIRYLMTNEAREGFFARVLLFLGPLLFDRHVFFLRRSNACFGTLMQRAFCTKYS
jgi:hypothetical protein